MGWAETAQSRTHSEVVESGIGQPTPGDIFGELIQHLGVLGLGEEEEENTSTWAVPAHLIYHMSLVMLLREKRSCYETHSLDGDTLTLCLRSRSQNARPCSSHPPQCLPSTLAAWVLPTTHMHGKDAAGDELSVLPDAEVPRLYPHHVVKHEL